MYDPALFRERSPSAQIMLGGLMPAALGALAGVLAGVSATAYWAVGALAGLGGFMGGFEHQDGWGGADRGFIGGAVYGTALLVARIAVGNSSKVSLGSVPALLAVVTAIAGMALSAAGGRVARVQRERSAGRSVGQRAV